MQITGTAPRKIATLRFAYGITGSRSGGGCFTRPARTGAGIGVVSRSTPWRFMTRDIRKIPTMLAGIVIRKDVDEV